jgi:hypothetical protein
MDIYGILKDKDFQEWNKKIHDEKGKKPRITKYKHEDTYDGVGITYVSFFLLNDILMRGAYLNTGDFFIQNCEKTDTIEEIQDYIRKNISNVDENLLKDAKYFRFMASNVGEYIGVFDNFENRNLLFSEVL